MYLNAMKIYKWSLDPEKYLTEAEVCKLVTFVKNRAKLACEKKKKVAVRDYFIIHLALSTGLRVMEIAALKCGDIFLDGPLSSLLVRNGKGGKRRMVYFNGAFKKHCAEYLKWKQQMKEPINPDKPVLLSSNTNTHMTRRAIQKAFKRCIEKADLPSFRSIHCLRHTYACFLLKASNWNLRLVQKQLGHSKITTTEVYADVMPRDMKKAVDRLVV
jgi:site-specific recombinase XerD